MAELVTKYQQYAEYKDSGVEWLDVIPMHWVMSKIKYIAPFQVGWTPPTGNDSNFIGENIWANISDLRGKVITDTVKRISDKAAKEASMDITPKGSLLYSFKLSVGSVSFAGCDMYTNEAIASFTSDSLLPLEYLYYILPKFLIENASTNIYGARILNQELIKNAIILKPTYEEAETIANFLDYETAQIDILIEKQQTLIQLLKEKRQAVISHAVTKGLNPDAPMKDSGVEWLGDVPEHWVVSPLKLYIDTRKGVAFKSADFTDLGVRVVKASDIKEKTIRQSDVFLPVYFSETYPKAILSEGDIVISTVGSTPDVKNSAVGQIGIVPVELDGSLLNQNTVVFTPRNNILENLFLFYLIQTDVYRDHLDLNAHGTANQASLNVSDMLNFTFARPSFKEQSEISEHIIEFNSSFDALEKNCLAAIQLMQERRTALISAVVTGKIDVRGWVAPESR